MAGGDETRDPQWGNHTARITFIVTVICAILFVAAAAFILNSDTGPLR
jgi:hypothetical protein